MRGWKLAQRQVERIADGALLWVSVNAEPRLASAEWARRGIRSSLLNPDRTAMRKLDPEGLPSVPVAYVLDPAGAILGKFVGPGSVANAVDFAAKR